MGCRKCRVVTRRSVDFTMLAVEDHVDVLDILMDQYGLISYRWEGRLPLLPTLYPPGSSGKIGVMTERARNRENLFHPLDSDHEGIVGGKKSR
jgi:hypothetical protein